MIVSFNIIFIIIIIIINIIIIIIITLLSVKFTSYFRHTRIAGMD